MYPIDPQQMLAMAYMGVSQEDYEAWIKVRGGIDLTVPCRRYCLKCECSQTTLANEPCWQCGNIALETTKPNWWPNITGTAVEGGNAWSYGQEERAA